jgi:hypothetical protein
MKKLFDKLFFPVIGLLSLIWFLIRVIPKPTRAAYPCMRATAPLASSFVLYILGFFSTIFFFKKARQFVYESRYILFSISLLLSISFGIYTFVQSNSQVYANSKDIIEGPNNPMGEGKGIFPGRVAWIYNPDATDETCTNESGDYWYQDDNTNQAVVDAMLIDGLKRLTEEETDTAAWDALFRHFNQQHDKGDVGYTAGEKIVIKINLNNGVSGSWYDRFRHYATDTSPQITYAILDQLINVVGVAQADIHAGDPGKNFDNIYWDKCQPDFPDVKYWGAANGRTPVVDPGGPVLFTSDGSEQLKIPASYVEAAYIINIPVFKKHHRAGISLTAKNNFGMLLPFEGDASALHPGLPAPLGNMMVTNGDYSVYRCLVDLMGHEHVGGKTLLYLIDGIWGSTNWGHAAIKWAMEPFNNEWPSSLFLSQDPVAIESVGFDFLYEEFDDDHPTEGIDGADDNTGPYPHFDGVEDYMHQAADSANWPDDIDYDPENDGSILPPSLGVHEHWDDPVTKRYSRNLGLDIGIQLVSNLDPTSIEDNRETGAIVSNFTLFQNYPNPFNSSTNIRYELTYAAYVQLKVYNILGQEIRTIVNEYQNAGSYLKRWDGLNNKGISVQSGVYIYKMVVNNNGNLYKEAKKLVYSK